MKHATLLLSINILINTGDVLIIATFNKKMKKLNWSENDGNPVDLLIRKVIPWKTRNIW